MKFPLAEQIPGIRIGRLIAVLFFFSVRLGVVAQGGPVLDEGEQRTPKISGAAAGELIVRFKPATTGEKKTKALKRVAGVARNVGRGGDVQVLKVEGDFQKAKETLAADPDVLYVEPNFKTRVFAGVIPDDFEFEALYAMRNTGEGGGKVGSDIKGPEAWEITTGSRDVLVAVIDTGIDYFHPDLRTNIWRNAGEIAGNGVDDDGNGYVDDIYGYDFVSGDSDPMDDHSHGTHVAGTIGAVGNNGIGVAGVAWNVRMMAVKAFDNAGNGTVSSAIEAIHYAIQRGVRIINASWGLEDRSRALADAFAEAEAAGVIVVAAAGNSKTETPFYPAGYESVIAVASTNNKDQRSAFSNYGAHVDISAPGEMILSTVPDGRYDAVSGTSMSAPHVTGTAALILSRHPGFNSRQVAAILKNTADVIFTDQLIGRGRLNAYAALQIDVPLPDVVLRAPKILSGRVDFTGTAAGENFERYALYYGVGAQPTAWTEFHSSAAQVTNATLLGAFDSSLLNDGIYTFKAVVWNRNGQAAADLLTAQVLNVQLSSPVSGDILRAGDSLVLRGTVFGQGRRYGISWTKGLKHNEWKTVGITQPGDGEVINGVLGIFDPSTVDPNEFYSFKLSATNASGQVQNYLANFVWLDSHLKPGWPIYLPYEGEYAVEDWRQAKVADLDGDGIKEIVLVDHGNSEGKIATLVVYRADGTLAWKRELNGDEPYTDVPTIGDVDGDGNSEIFVDVGAKLYAFAHNGSTLPGLWPLTLSARRLGKTLADLDGDGKLEVIALANMQAESQAGAPVWLSTYDREGNLLQRWTLGACGAETTSQRNFPVVVNMDKDSEPEIILVTGCSAVAMYDLKKADGPVWLTYLAGSALSTPVVADLSNDGGQEIVVATSSVLRGVSAGVYVLNDEGNTLPGWPALTTDSFSTAPVVGDIDGDGKLEIVVAGDFSYRIFALARDGFEVPGWPVPIDNRSTFGGLSLGDINGDEIYDVILAAPGYMALALFQNDPGQVGGITAWNGRGQKLSLNGFNSSYASVPIENATSSGYHKSSTATLTDLDRNGLLDVVASSIRGRTYLASGSSSGFKDRSALYAWEFEVDAPSRETPWPEFHRSPNNNAYLPPPESEPIPPIVLAIPDQIVAVGQTFAPIPLNQYLEFPGPVLTNLFWSATGQNELRVEIDSNSVARVTAPTQNWQGLERITFSVTDRSTFTRSTNAVFEARPNFFPPRANPESVALVEDTEIIVDVLANDTNPTAGAMAVEAVGRPGRGKATLLPDGKVLYAPATNYFGSDSFTYIVKNDSGARSVGLVTIEVTPVNDLPAPKEDRALTIEERSITIDALANDLDPDGDLLTVVNVIQPTDGVVVVTAAYKLFFQPKAGFNGTNTFIYTVTDGKSAPQSASVTVVVRPANSAPVAKGQNVVMNRNSTKEIVYLADDIDGDAVTFRILKAPQHGELFSYPTLGSYTPRKGFSGSDSFSYKASDGFLESAEAFVNITIVDTNNAPSPTHSAVITRVNQSVNITLKATDLDDDPVTFEILTQPRNGTLTGVGSNYVYRPKLDFIGQDDFTFAASDGRDSATGRVSVETTDKNTAPGANPKLVKTTPNTPADFVITGADAESDPLQFTLLSQPRHGILLGVAPNLTYMPTTNYVGPDRFRFSVRDAEFTSDPAPVTFAVAPKNSVPSSSNQTVITYTADAVAFPVDARDADNDPLECVILKGPRTGRLFGSGTNFVYTPGAGFSTVDSFTYKAWDGKNYGNEAFVRIERSFTPPPPAPPRFDAIQITAGGLLQIRLTNQLGQAFRLESSTNLQNWVGVSNVVSPGNFLFAVPVTNSQLFYRAINQ